jgi:hypothetical protein
VSCVNVELKTNISDIYSTLNAESQIPTLKVTDILIFIDMKCANITMYKELPVSCTKQVINVMNTGLPYSNTNEPNTWMLL